MTPEAENELVARWMGWRTLKDYNGMTRWAPPDASPASNLMTCEPIPPPYRTDPALLWELEGRLMGYPYWWTFQCYGDPDRCEGMNFDRDSVTTESRADAVFAAAVWQAEQEGK